jgi:SOS-response transcriptional repressor LexA
MKTRELRKQFGELSSLVLDDYAVREVKNSLYCKIKSAQSAQGFKVDDIVIVDTARTPIESDIVLVAVKNGHTFCKYNNSTNVIGVVKGYYRPL